MKKILVLNLYAVNQEEFENGIGSFNNILDGERVIETKVLKCSVLNM